jgi:cephalosporin hydroxylase
MQTNVKIYKRIISFFNNFEDPSNLLNPIINKDCSEFEVNNWTISELIIRKLVKIVGIKPFPLNELMLMIAAVCRIKPTHIFEWGTHVGKSARVFYETVRYFHLSCEIYSVDLPDDSPHPEHPHGKRGFFVKGLPGVTLYQGDGLDVSLALYKNIRTKSRPLFFLDGDHEYRSVKRELEGIIKYIPQASILIHDTFYQSSKSGYNIGPYKAVQKFLGQSQTKYQVMSTNLGLPGLTLLIPELYKTDSQQYS